MISCQPPRQRTGRTSIRHQAAHGFDVSASGKVFNPNLPVLQSVFPQAHVTPLSNAYSPAVRTDEFGFVAKNQVQSREGEHFNPNISRMQSVFPQARVTPMTGATLAHRIASLRAVAAQEQQDQPSRIEEHLKVIREKAEEPAPAPVAPPAPAPAEDLQPLPEFKISRDSISKAVNFFVNVNKQPADKRVPLVTAVQLQNIAKEFYGLRDRDLKGKNIKETLVEMIESSPALRDSLGITPKGFVKPDAAAFDVKNVLKAARVFKFPKSPKKKPRMAGSGMSVSGARARAYGFV